VLFRSFFDEKALEEAEKQKEAGLEKPNPNNVKGEKKRARFSLAYGAKDLEEEEEHGEKKEHKEKEQEEQGEREKEEAKNKEEKGGKEQEEKKQDEEEKKQEEEKEEEKEVVEEEKEEDESVNKDTPSAPGSTPKPVLDEIYQLFLNLSPNPLQEVSLSPSWSIPSELILQALQNLTSLEKNISYWEHVGLADQLTLLLQTGRDILLYENEPFLEAVSSPRFFFYSLLFLPAFIPSMKKKAFGNTFILLNSSVR